MSDIRSESRKISIVPVSNLTFEVVENTANGGFKVQLNWSYDILKFPDVVAFKVYKAVVPKPRLNKEFLITQKLLEKTTSNKSFSNRLYNKSLFSQNSKVKFENSNSVQHDKLEGNISNYQFNNISVLRADKKILDYDFEDRNIKFGETYIYYVSAIASNLQETQPNPIIANIESLKHPNPPSYFEASETDKGIILIFGKTFDKNISNFKIYKKEDSEKDFQFLATVESNKDMGQYLDIDIFPKKNYIYKIYSENIFGFLSFSAIQTTAVFKYVPPWSNIEYQPSIQIDGDAKNGIKIRVRNERKDKVSYIRIERRDDWLFQRKFEVKPFDGDRWLNSYYFNNDGIVDFVDNFVFEDGVYSYRVTAFNLSGFPISYFVTPPMKPGEVYGILNSQLPKTTKPRLINFDMNVINQNQKNVFVKCNWKISGDWSYLILNDGDRDVKIDNIHPYVFLDGFRKGKKYQLKVAIFDEANMKHGELSDLILNI